MKLINSPTMERFPVGAKVRFPWPPLCKLEEPSGTVVDHAGFVGAKYPVIVAIEMGDGRQVNMHCKADELVIQETSD